MKVLKIGLTSKGRLYEGTRLWFSELGLNLDHNIEGREYSAKINGSTGISVSFLTAAEIPQELAMGRLDLGITGQDLIRENVPNWEEFIFELCLLNFGYSSLVLAVPKFWVDVESLDDFDSVSTMFRKDRGFRLRIATKYHNLVWAYLRRMGVADYQLVNSRGATEGAIKNNRAEAIADIVSSGKTLEANHLKVIGEEPILRSQAALLVSKKTNWCSQKSMLFKEFCGKIGQTCPNIFYDLQDP